MTKREKETKQKACWYFQSYVVFRSITGSLLYTETGKGLTGGFSLAGLFQNEQTQAEPPGAQQDEQSQHLIRLNPRKPVARA